MTMTGFPWQTKVVAKKRMRCTMTVNRSMKTTNVINLNATQGNFERLTFVNHTDSHCVEKSQQNASEYALHYHQLNAGGLENLSNDQYRNVHHATLKGERTVLYE
uniref:Uncharacterized protein n=1 Tax=Glossina austeni TaxID=7395 RepID=A0A1A9UZ60_GLOAU